MAANANASPGKTLLLMAIFVVVGLPMVAYLWDLLNDLLAFKADPVRLLIGVPVLLVFAGFLKLLARRLRQWDAAHATDRST